MNNLYGDSERERERGREKGKGETISRPIVDQMRLRCLFYYRQIHFSRWLLSCARQK